ncbi:MAG: AcrR family transcriptional regulator [Gammaproteobacteria bacterium]|jgi:AcrR family transcriptional regulator
MTGITQRDNLTNMKFEEYKASFPYRGKSIYTQLFTLHCDNIKTKKPKFAVNNLEKIFRATFKISSKIGFHEMSLRSLCKETGLSMGGIYSCIESKEMIAIMIKDMVNMVSSNIIDNALMYDDKSRALEEIITQHIFATELLQPWFYFLYFETRSLSSEHQKESKTIELKIISTLENLLSQIAEHHENDDKKFHFIATMAMSMVQEHYLKRWKYKDASLTIDNYADETLKLVYASLKN